MTHYTLLWILPSPGFLSFVMKQYPTITSAIPLSQSSNTLLWTTSQP